MSADAANPGPAETPVNWVENATDAVRSGMSDAQKSAENILPAIGAAMSKGVFNVAYGIGYGVTFPVALAAKLIPQENCVVWGLVDGAAMAQDTANRNIKGS